MTSTWTGSAWSCTVRLVVEDARTLRAATADLLALLDRVDCAASRFRADSALSVANARAGRPVAVPQLLVDLVDAALTAARDTDGAVDPTVGADVIALGYDRDFAALRPSVDVMDAAATGTHRPHRAGWARGSPRSGRRPAHRAPRHGARPRRHGQGVDGLTTAAVHPRRPLRHRRARRTRRRPRGRRAPGRRMERGGAERQGAAGQLVNVTRGGVATSTTTVRRWVTAGAQAHHIVDPSTGRPADGPWRTVSVHAGSALTANTLSTAAIVRGPAAFADGRVTARTVDQDGGVSTFGAWPADHVRRCLMDLCVHRPRGGPGRADLCPPRPPCLGALVSRPTTHHARRVIVQ